jgi:hypothetical protein
MPPILQALALSGRLGFIVGSSADRAPSKPKMKTDWTKDAASIAVAILI